MLKCAGDQRIFLLLRIFGASTIIISKYFVIVLKLIVKSFVPRFCGRWLYRVTNNSHLIKYIGMSHDFM